MFDRMLDFGFVIFVDVSGVVGVSSTTALLFDALFDFLPDMISRRFYEGLEDLGGCVEVEDHKLQEKLSDRLPRGPLIVDVNDTFYTNGQFKNEVIVIVVMMQLLICGLHIQRTALRIIYYISNMTSHFTAVQEAHHDSEKEWTKYFSLVSFGYSLKQLLILM